jgi:hypothetical protein
MHKRNNTNNRVQKMQNTVSTSIHITKAPTHTHTHTYKRPHITEQVKTTTLRVKTNTVQDIPKRKCKEMKLAEEYC